MCGSAYCPAQLVSQLPEDDLNLTSSSSLVENDNFRIEPRQIYMLAGIYLGCSICAAVIIAVFVDPISRFGQCPPPSLHCI